MSPIGDITGADGRAFKIDGDALLTSITTNGLDIPLDANHDFGEALGWFPLDSFELREDGLYATLEFNAKGTEANTNKSYRYLSPVYMMGNNNTVIGLDSVGFVNRPNLLNMALNKKEEERKSMSPEEIAQLKADIIKEVKESVGSPDTNTKMTEVESEISVLEADTLKELGKDSTNISELKNKVAVVQEALFETNRKLNALGNPHSLTPNSQTPQLSANDKKVAMLLGITEEAYLVSKGAN